MKTVFIRMLFKVTDQYLSSKACIRTLRNNRSCSSGISWLRTHPGCCTPSRSNALDSFACYISGTSLFLQFQSLKSNWNFSFFYSYYIEFNISIIENLDLNHNSWKWCKEIELKRYNFKIGQDNMHRVFLTIKMQKYFIIRIFMGRHKYLVEIFSSDIQ